MRGASLDEIEAVYRARLPEFVRVAAAIAGGVEAGRDAVHDGFVAAVKGRVSRERLGRGVAVAGGRHERAQAQGRAVRAAAPAPSPSGRPADDAPEVRAAVLPERQRLVLFLRYYADLDYESIAAVLGIRLGTVGAALHAAQAVRGRLEEVET